VGPRRVESRAIVSYLRLLYGRRAFGKGCRVGRGFHFTASDGATVRFGQGCILGRDITIELNGGSARLDVGAHTLLGDRCTISVGAHVRIGSDCLIAEMVTIRDHDHRFARSDMPFRLQGSFVRSVLIGSNVWLGSKVTVTKGVSIGDNVVVGAGAVVTRDIPANAVAVGVPARAVRPRET